MPYNMLRHFILMLIHSLIHTISIRQLLPLLRLDTSEGQANGFAA